MGRKLQPVHRHYFDIRGIGELACLFLEKVGAASPVLDNEGEHERDYAECHGLLLHLIWIEGNSILFELLELGHVLWHYFDYYGNLSHKKHLTWCDAKSSVQHAFLLMTCRTLWSNLGPCLASRRADVGQADSPAGKAADDFHTGVVRRGEFRVFPSLRAASGAVLHHKYCLVAG